MNKPPAQKNTQQAVRSNLPTPATSFVGRAREIADAREQLAKTRLLTLTGAGGCGKTRLALNLARDQSPAFGDGAWWVELADLKEPELVPQTVAQALGLREVPGEAPGESLRRQLQSKHLLLILDNCEHLISACARLGEALLRECPELEIIATSREPLALAGETTWLVPSMSVPEVDTADLMEYDATRLFVERATSVLPSFSMTRENARAIWQICRRLDGIPLAIELAAARVNVLAAGQIAARLDDRFQLLTSGRLVTLPRHRTLRAAIDWSYDSLSPQEQMLFRRLAVFVGGFTIQATEVVCANQGDNEEKITVGSPNLPVGVSHREVLDLLSHLIDKSLVVADTQRRGEARYRLLETLGEYGKEKLAEAGEERALRQRHHDWFLALAEQGEPELEGEHQVAWMDRLELEHDNLRAAFELAAQQQNFQAMMRLASSLRIFWHLRGYWSEGRERLTRALAPARALGHTAAVANALNGAGLLAWDQGEYDPAQAFFAKSLAIWEELGNPSGMVASLDYLGALAWLRGNYATARSALEQALTLGRESNLVRGVGLSLGLLGVVERDGGDYARAEALLEESIQIARHHGLVWIQADSLDTLGGLLRLQGHTARAAAALEESLALSRELGNKWGMSFSLSKLGLIARDQGSYGRATELLKESLVLRQEIADRRGIAHSLEGLAGVAAAQQDYVRAARLFGTAEALRESIGAPVPNADREGYEQETYRLRGKLGQEAFDREWGRGRLTNPDESMVYALTTATPQVTPTASELDGTAAELCIFALGAPRVYRGGHLLSSSDWTYSKARELLFYLLSHYTLTKEQIGLDLWPEASPEQVRRNLKVALHHLRRTLGGREWVLLDKQGYAFNRALAPRYWYDVEVFETKLRQAQALAATAPERAIQLLGEATGLYRGDWLADLNAGDWSLARQETSRRQYIEGLLMLGGLRFARSEYAEAAEVYRRTLEHDNFQESAHRGLMRCYARQGELGQALRHYQGLVNLMRTELRAQPAPETTSLYERLRHGDLDQSI